MRYLLIMFLCFLFIYPALASEPDPGDACSPNGISVTTGGSGNGYWMVCQGETWKVVLSHNAAGSLTRLGNQDCANGQTLKFNGDIWACAEDENDSGLTDPPVCSGANAALQWNGANWNCATIAGGGGGGGPPIVNGDHTQQQCIDAGGTINLSDFGGAILCTFSGLNCPAGWTPYGRWYRTAKTCSACSSCTLPAGWMTTTAARSCNYGQTKYMTSCMGSLTCTQAAGAGVTTVACY